MTACYTVQTVPEGATSPPMTASEATFLAVRHTGESARWVESCMESLGALVPRVTVEAADRDHVAVRITRVKENV